MVGGCEIVSSAAIGPVTQRECVVCEWVPSEL